MNDPDTSQYSSDYITDTTLSSDILENRERKTVNNLPHGIPGASSATAAASHPTSSSGYSSQTHQATALPTRNDDGDPLESRYDDGIPSNCRMDTLEPSLANIRSNRDQGGSKNAQSATWRSSPFEEIPERKFSKLDSGMVVQPSRIDVSSRKWSTPEKDPSGQARIHPKTSAARDTLRRNVLSPKQIVVSSADIDEQKLEKVEKNLGTFTKRIDAATLIPYLRTCLPDAQYTHIRRQCERGENPRKVNQLLWSYLKRVPDWWKYFEDALEECGYTKLLKIMQE